jgi:hypothetical protein
MKTMASLSEAFTQEAKKSEVVDACCDIIEQEVGDKSGLSGFAIKAGYGAVKNVKPGFVRKVVSDLLPEFAVALEPIYQEAKTQSKPIAAHLAANSGRVADALLTITDAKAAKSTSGVVKGTYDKLRGSAKKNVEAAVPRLAKLVERFAE